MNIQTRLNNDLTACAYDIQFDFASSDLADMRVGGVFHVGEVDEMLDAIETNFGLRVERTGDNVVRIEHAPN